MSTEVESRTIQLADGRHIGMAEVGVDKGHPIFWFHGWPGSRFGVLSAKAAAEKGGARVIGLDRPGIGLSSPRPGRTILDWADDVIGVADAMEIESFSVAGISGGGPYALACAHRIPQRHPNRLTAVGLIAGMGPMELGIGDMRQANQQLFGLASRANWLLRFFFWLGIGRHATSGNMAALEALIPKMLEDLPLCDRDVLKAPEIQPRFAQELQAAFAQGARWVAKEGALYTKDWGFSLAELTPIPTYLWHGKLDVNVPMRMGQEMARLAPHIQATFDDEEGHISIFARYQDEIIEALCRGSSFDAE